MSKKDERKWYHRLECRHIRMIDLSKMTVKIGETSVYCRQCDRFQLVIERMDQSGSRAYTSPVKERN